MTRLKKDLKNPTEQTNLTGWSKLTNKRTNVIDIRSDSHFTAKLIYQLYKLIERRHVRRTNNCLLDSHVFCSGQSLVTTTKLSFQLNWKFMNFTKKRRVFFHARRKNLDQCHFKLYPLLCAINCVRFSFGSNICCKTVMPGHEVFRIRESFDTLIPDERIRNANQTKSDNLVVNQIITVFMFSC